VLAAPAAAVAAAVAAGRVVTVPPEQACSRAAAKAAAARVTGVFLSRRTERGTDDIDESPGVEEKSALQRMTAG
jgi:hypothetical protein